MRAPNPERVLETAVINWVPSERVVEVLQLTSKAQASAEFCNDYQ